MRHRTDALMRLQQSDGRGSTLLPDDEETKGIETMEARSLRSRSRFGQGVGPARSCWLRMWVSPVPAQMWAVVGPVPGADVAGVSPVPAQMWRG
jgi:hypothetical protein